MDQAYPEEISASPQTLVPSRAVTYTIIVLNVLVFLAMVLSGLSPIAPKAQQVIPWGASLGPLTLNGQWWRLLTACFVHFGIVHIGMNMIILFQIGPFAETLYGKVRYLCLYLLAGLGGSIVSLSVHPMSVAAGASGAIFGVYGGVLAFLAVRHSVIGAARARQIAKSAVIFILYNLVYGMVRQTTDIAAHGGGLLTGFVIGALLARPFFGRTRQPSAAQTLTVVAAALLLLIAGFRAVARSSPARGDWYKQVALASSVPLGQGGHLLYSGSATRAEAQTLAQRITQLGFARRTADILFSRNAGGPVLSFKIGQEDSAYQPIQTKTSRLVDGKSVIVPSQIPAERPPWDDPKAVAAFTTIGVQLAPIVGGPPLQIRLLNTRGELRKTIAIDTRQLMLGNDSVWYRGAASEQDAQALGKALQSCRFFRGAGALVLLSRQTTGADVTFMVADKALQDPNLPPAFQQICRGIPRALGGGPVTAHLTDDMTFQPAVTFPMP